ncbi:MAG TPA: zf-HC2 domain-containing protein [Thermoanaerobaculia bacterium]|nr:zf-HC2 domain-containing protein [Thermoanaerobaculia bacterium]
MSSSDFHDTLLELIDASPEPMNHPTPDQWIAYQRGELAAGEEERLQEHLVRCRACFDLAEAAAAFAKADDEPDASHEVESAALWRLLRPQLEPPETRRENVREISDHPRRRSSWKFHLPTYLAASFFVMLLGLSAWNLQLRSAREALRAPQPNAPIGEIPGGERAVAGHELTVPQGTRMFVFYPAVEAAVYRLVIRDAATSRELLSIDDLRPNKVPALTLYLPEGLRPGRYRLELLDGAGRKAGEVLETHLLRVAEPGRRD